MTDNLEQKREALTAKLEGLRVAPTVAALVKEADDAVAGFKAEVGALEEQIDQIDRAIGARERSRRADAEQQRLDQRAADRKRLVELAEERREAVAAAEAGARQFVASIGRLLEVNAKMARLTYELTGKSTGMALNEMDTISRLSSRLGAVMVTIPKHRRFGAIEFPGASLFPASESWSDVEERLVAAAIQPALEGSK